MMANKAYQDLARGSCDNVKSVWLFDLDETLYPPQTGLMEALSARISQFLEQRLKLPPPVAEAMREAYFGRYGSSVSGVLRHCQVDPAEFLTFIHDLPVDSYLRSDPELAALLDSLPGRKFIFTNATSSHAQRVLRTLEVEGFFEAIFDIHFLHLEGKPSRQAYERVLRHVGRASSHCWFVEDSEANLVPAHALGCRTVWLTPDGSEPPRHVDFRIHELSELLSLVDGSTHKPSGEGDLS